MWHDSVDATAAPPDGQARGRLNGDGCGAVAGSIWEAQPRHLFPVSVFAAGYTVTTLGMKLASTTSRVAAIALILRGSTAARP